MGEKSMYVSGESENEDVANSKGFSFSQAVNTDRRTLFLQSRTSCSYFKSMRFTSHHLHLSKDEYMSSMSPCQRLYLPLPFTASQVQRLWMHSLLKMNLSGHSRPGSEVL